MKVQIKYTGQKVLISEVKTGGLTTDEIRIDAGGCKAVIHLPVSKVNQPSPDTAGGRKEG